MSFLFAAFNSVNRGFSALIGNAGWHMVWRHLTLPSTTAISQFTMGLSLDLGTPVNTALMLYILYSVQKIVYPPTPAKSTSIPTEFKHGYSWMPKSHPPTVLFQTYTPKTLEKYNGKESERIMLAIDGTVFDVSAGKSFYGPGACNALLLQRTCECGLLIHNEGRWYVWELCG